MSTAILQLHHREHFETDVLLAVAAGAGSGALQLLLQRFFEAPPWPLLPVVGVALSAVRGDRIDRALLAILAVTLPSAAWLFGMAPGWTVAVAGAATGALLIRAGVCERGEEGQVARVRPGWTHHAAGAALGAGLALAGTEVARGLGTRLSALATPALLHSVAEGAAIGLFLGLASVAGHLALRADPVEARIEALLPSLSGDYRALSTRALTLYRRCGELLSRLPRDPAREELARTLGQMTLSVVELAAEWTGVEAELPEQTGRELQAEIESLRQSAASAHDAVARRQLEGAAEALEEEAARLGAIRCRRERIVARLRSELALLERARVALLGLRSGHAQLRAAELAALARTFAGLSRAQGDEAALADEVATSAESLP